MAKFKVGDQVRFVMYCKMDPIPKWVQESINTKPLTISEVCHNGDDITYFVCELPYGYSEDWFEPIEEVAKKPKFKIGDIVVKNTEMARLLWTNKDPIKITEVLEVYNTRTKEFRYRYILENCIVEYDEDDLELADKDNILVQALKICSNGKIGCKGCYYQSISDGCNKLERDAADCIERLKAKIKELEKNGYIS